MLVAMLAVRKASIRCPEGMSNVLIIESSDVIMSHRESEENVYARCSDEIRTLGQGIGELTRSRTRPLNPLNSRTILWVSVSKRRTMRSSHVIASRPLSRWRVIEMMAAGMMTVCSRFDVWKSKN